MRLRRSARLMWAEEERGLEVEVVIETELGRVAQPRRGGRGSVKVEKTCDAGQVTFSFSFPLFAALGARRTRQACRAVCLGRVWQIKVQV